MRICPLPAQQEALNARVNRGLRALLVLSILSMLAAVLMLGAVYLRGPRQRFMEAPRLVAADGSTALGPVVVFTPDLAVTTAETPAGAQVLFPGSRPVAVTAVRSETLNPETKLTLLRLAAAAPDPFLPALISAPSNGMRVTAASSAEGVWEGVLEEKEPGIYSTQPALTVGPGAPVYATPDPALVGITARAQGASVVVSTERLYRAFPELRGGR